MPWEFFLGNAAHRIIAYIYSVRYPRNAVFYNTKTLKNILEESAIGDWSQLSKAARDLRPDITDRTRQNLLEIKPGGDHSLQEGLREVDTYLAALNQTLPPKLKFSAGTGFQGEILIKFAQGVHIWRLDWNTTAPDRCGHGHGGPCRGGGPLRQHLQRHELSGCIRTGSEEPDWWAGRQGDPLSGAASPSPTSSPPSSRLRHVIRDEDPA